MKKVLLLLLVTIFYLLPVHSQTADELGVDTVRITCLYQQVCVLDTLKPEEKYSDLMLLQIGNHLSKYHSYANYLTDSLILEFAKKAQIIGYSSKNTAQELLAERRKLPQRPRIGDFQIFKQYPQKGQLTFSQYFGSERNVYEEVIPDFHWKLSNDTLTVCGYLCKKATTAFRGRNYEVWYTQEIPISDGPWKFNGLPGLILKVIDEQGFFSFECIAIETPSEVKPIKFHRGKSDRKISRKELNKAFQRFMDNPGAYMSGSPLILETMPASAYKKRPYNPIERTDE